MINSDRLVIIILRTEFGSYYVQTKPSTLISSCNSSISIFYSWPFLSWITLLLVCYEFSIFDCVILWNKWMHTNMSFSTVSLLPEAQISLSTVPLFQWNHNKRTFRILSINHLVSGHILGGDWFSIFGLFAAQPL